jgi:hypothetical protein
MMAKKREHEPRRQAMHQISRAQPAVYVRIELYHGRSRGGPGDPLDLPEAFEETPHLSNHRNGTGRLGGRMRIVPAPGGAAFVEDMSAGERR